MPLFLCSGPHDCCVFGIILMDGLDNLVKKCSVHAVIAPYFCVQKEQMFSDKAISKICGGVQFDGMLVGTFRRMAGGKCRRIMLFPYKI